MSLDTAAPFIGISGRRPTMGKRSNAARALACAAPRHYHSVRHSRQRCGRIARRMARLASGSPELPRRASAPFAHLSCTCRQPAGTCLAYPSCFRAPKLGPFCCCSSLGQSLESTATESHKGKKSCVYMGSFPSKETSTQAIFLGLYQLEEAQGGL